MYSERDFAEINRRIRQNAAVLIPVLAALIAAYIYALKARVQPLAMGAGAAILAALCFGIGFYLLPNLRYRGFLRDMQAGLTREMTGSVVAIAEKPEPQDGARVHQVRLLLKDEQDERIVYLNTSKRELFPPVGTMVRVKLYGRHIREVEAI